LPITEFQVGQIVHLKTNSSVHGPVIAVVSKTPENRYTVFIDGENRMFYASQIALDEDKKFSFEKLSINQFHSFLTSLQIRHPSIANLYSLNSARIDFIPYQFRPVFKFIRSDRPRLLIADASSIVKAAGEEDIASLRPWCSILQRRVPEVTEAFWAGSINERERELL